MLFYSCSRTTGAEYTRKRRLSTRKLNNIGTTDSWRLLGVGAGQKLSSAYHSSACGNLRHARQQRLLTSGVLVRSADAHPPDHRRVARLDMPDHSPRQPRYGRRVRGFRYDRPRHKRESGGLHRRRPPQTARRGGDAGVRTGPSRFGLKVRKGGLHYCQLPKLAVIDLARVFRFET